MTIFEEIEWRNFLSTGNVPNKVILNQTPSTLIVGRNGHGKSTLLDALTFALFGKPFRDTNKPKLVNSINKKDCVVKLKFSIGSKKFMVIRGISPSVFEIWIDGVLLKQDSIAGDYQTYFEDSILKFTYKAFTQIAILGSKSFVPFMKLKTAERRAIIDNLIDIEIFSSMAKLAKEAYTKAKDSVETNKNALDTVQQKITLQKKYVEEAKKNNQGRIDELNEQLKEYQNRLESLQKDGAIIRLKIDELKRKSLERAPIEAALRTMEGVKSKIESKKTKAEQDLEFYEGHDDCPTCRQKIDDAFKAAEKEKANKVLETMNDNMLTFNEKKKELLDKLEQAVNYTNQYNNEVTELNRKQAICSGVLDNIKKLEQEIKTLSTKKVLSDDMMEISKNLLSEYENLNSSRKELIENRAYYETAVNLLKDGGIKTQIIRQYLPVINSLVNKYLTAMDFCVSFELNEEFEETIKSRHRDGFTYGSFSEGEKQRIDIALLFAWRAVAKLKNSLNTNLLIMDEIFDSSLDGDGANLVISILSTLPTGTNVFVVSHRELLNEDFSRTIKVEKHNNFSQIVEGEPGV